MRRRVGVGHVLQEKQQQQKMADLGAQITAERVGQIEDQLEELQQQLSKLAQDHKSDIKEDPIVRARFRQLADSLGVDLISSKKNVFAGALGLGDFYYQLAGRAVEACMRERKFCGSYVPLQRVQFFVQKAYDSTTLPSGSKSSDGVKRTVISEADILTALSKLSVLGAGYNAVKLGGVSYIQTTPDGGSGGDAVLLLNFVLGLQKTQVEKAKKDIAAERRRAAAAAEAAAASGDKAAAKAAAAAASASKPRSGVGAAYALGSHPFEQSGSFSGDADIELSFAQQCVSIREAHIVTGLNWTNHRARAALKRMVQEGTVWVEEPRPRSNAPSPKARASSKGRSKAVLSATETEVWKGKRKAADDEVNKEDVAYWFVSLTSHA